MYVCLCFLLHSAQGSAHDNSKGLMDGKCSAVQEQITNQHDEKRIANSCNAERFASINPFSC